MKILHVIANISPRYGGPSKACKDMCRTLANAGQHVTIYTTDRDYPLGKLNVIVNTMVKQDGYNVCYFPVQFGPYMISLGMMTALSRHTNDFDILHIHGLYRFPQTIACYFARKYGVPYIISPHGSLDPFLFNKKKNKYVKRIYEYLIEAHNLNKAGAIHFTCEEESRLTKPLGIKAPGTIVPIGLELPQYSKLPERGRFREKHHLGNAKIILHLGRINFKKGLDILVKAFAKAARTRNNVYLIVAGPDNEGYRAQVDEWITEEGINEKTIFTGMLLGEEIFEVLRDADIFALPSYSENFGIAVAEAMACELPVVISDRVNIWREVKSAGAGLVTPCNVNEVANAFIELLDDREKRQQMGEAGKKLVRKTYNWESIEYDLILTYKRIVEKAQSERRAIRK